MLAICHYNYTTIQTGLEKVAKCNTIVTIARNIINFLIAISDVTGKIHRFKHIAAPIKVYLKIFKDVSARFVFTVTAAEILTPAFWDPTKTTFVKRGNRFCKLVYSGLETFFLVPNKWRQLTSPVGALICKDIFVIAAAGFGVLHASEEIKEARQIIKKNEERLKHYAPVHISSNKRNALLKVAEEISASQKIIVSLNAELNNLSITPEHVRKIYKTSLLVEKEKHELYQKKEKQRRILNSLGEGKGDNAADVQDFKMRKACTKIDLYQRQVTKNQLIRGFEITKIILVTLQCLLIPGVGAAHLSLIGTGIFVSSLGIGSISLALIAYDIFFWKNPKNVVYPTTNLSV